MATVTITYSNIIKKCEMFSAFEGKTLVDGNGESRHAEIRITNLESDLVIGYIEQGLRLVDAEIGDGTIIEASEQSEGTDSGIGRSVEETLAAYVMHMWLSDKAAERSNAYRKVFDEMLSATKRLVWKRNRPTMNEE